MLDAERASIERALSSNVEVAQVLVLLAIEQRLDEIGETLASLYATFVSQS